MSARDRLITAPLWFLFLYFAVAFAGLTLILPHPGSGRSLTGAAIGGLGFAVGMTFWMAVLRHRDRAALGGRASPQSLPVARALRTGEPPTDPALDVPLLGLVALRRRRLRWVARAYPWIFAGLLALSLVFTITDSSAVWLIYAGISVCMLVLTAVAAHRESIRLSRLEYVIRSRSNPEPTS